MASKNSRATTTKVNLGSGGALIDGFINVDAFITSEAPNFRKADLRRLPFEAGSVDYALANNVLEHLPMADIPAALWELRRVLKTGGRAVIIVPDFRCLARQWLEMEKGGFHAVIHRWLSEEIYGNQHHEGEYHRAPMTPSYLNYVLQMVGFTNYKMTLFPAGSPPPDDETYPGCQKPRAGDFIRNDMIIADITK